MTGQPAPWSDVIAMCAGVLLLVLGPIFLLRTWVVRRGDWVKLLRRQTTLGPTWLQLDAAAPLNQKAMSSTMKGQCYARGG